MATDDAMDIDIDLDGDFTDEEALEVNLPAAVQTTSL